MSVQTRVIWNLPMNETSKIEIEAQAQLLTDQGKQTSQPTYDLQNNQSYVYRHWIDTETANQWINFVLPYQPASAEILN
jgi:hypothetical protein